MGSIKSELNPDIIEQLLLIDPNVSQGRVFNIETNNNEAVWAVAIALEKEDGAQQTAPEIVVKQIRKKLLTAMKVSGNKMPVPKKWYVLKDLPVDKHGVIDDKQLRMALSPAEQDVEMSTENMLRFIVSKVLRLEETGMLASTSFIQLGGDSITAIEVMSRCQEKGINLKVRDIMQCESLALLAGLAEGSANPPTDTTSDTEIGPSVPSIASLATRTVQYWNAPTEYFLPTERESIQFSIPETIANQLLSVCDKTSRVSPAEVCIAAVHQSFRKTFADRQSLATAFPPVFSSTGRIFCEHSLPSMSDFGMAISHARDIAMRGQVAGFDPSFTELSLSFIDEDRSSVFSNTPESHKKTTYPTNSKNIHENRFMNGEDRRKHVAEWPIENGSKSEKGNFRSLFCMEFSLLTGSDLSIRFEYPKNMSQQGDLFKWMAECRATLEKEIPLLEKAKPIYSLSDFPNIKLTYNELSQFTDVINKIDFDSIDKVYPTSPVQDGILLALLQTPELYRIDYVLEIKNTNYNTPIDLNLLEKSWSDVVAYHPTLRTIFVSSVREDAVFEQVVLKGIKPEIRRISTASNSNEAVSALQALQEASFADDQPAHLFTICDTTDGHVHCRLEISHAIMDGMSGATLFQDICQAYSGNLPPLPASDYSDYIGHLQNRPKGSSMEHWVNLLDGIQPCHFPILVEQASNPRRIKNVPINVGKHDIRGFCMSHNITGAMLIQAIWGIVLRGYTLSNDVSFGFLSSGRDVPIVDIGSMVGPLINLLLCRIEFDQMKTLDELFKTLKSQLNTAMDNQNISLAEIQHKVAPGKRQIFNTLLSILYSGSDISATDNGIAVNGFINYAPTDYDITLYINLSGDKIVISMDYVTSLLSDAQARSLVASFEKVMDTVLNIGSNELAAIEVISGVDKAEITTDHDLFSAPRSCSHWQIQEQIKTTPAAPAVNSWDRNLTYSDLDFFASRMAWRLKQLGAGPGIMIPVCFPKSAWVIVSMVAVNMAGAAFVPLDPTAPLKRLQGIMEDSGAKIILTAPEYASKLSEMKMDVFVVDEARLSKLQPPPRTGKMSSVGPDDPSFMIFTSGSTGRPKGMVHNHSGISATARAYGGSLLVGPGTRVFQFSAYTFDIGILDVLVTLMRGACVCIPSEHARVNDLAGAISTAKANWVFLTPTVADLLSPHDIPSIKRLILGGEAVPKKLVDRFKDTTNVVGIYGPAEASNCAHNPDISASPKSTNIGTPIGSAFWVVNPDNYKELIPIGCVGELLIQGPMLSRGYLNVDSAAAANFLEGVDFLPDNGFQFTRAYRTGDLVRRNHDGTFNYIGRKDTQVKLHGQRIELGEIETRLYELTPQNMGIMVDVLNPKSTDRKILAAFLWFIEDRNSANNSLQLVDSLSESMGETITALSSTIATILPSYMVPSVWLILQGKPERTVSGKVSRRHLVEFGNRIAMDEIARFSLTAVNIEPPTTPMELRLRDLWATVLDLSASEIGKNDAFLQIGGDSITAIRLVSLAKKSGIALTIATIFEDSRLSHMAISAVTGEKEKAHEMSPFCLFKDSEVDSVKRTVQSQCGLSNMDEIEDAYPCTSLQEGLMALSMKQPGSYIAKHIYVLPKDIDIPRFTSAWEQTLRDCDNLSTRIVLHDTLSIQSVINDRPAWESTTGMDLTSFLDEMKHVRMEYGSRLCRYALVSEPSGSQYFILILHHAVFDGWSLNLVLETLQNLYYGKSLENLEPYSAFIRYISEVNHNSAAEYWENQLRGSQPTTFPRTGNNESQHAPRIMKTNISYPKSTENAITKATVLRATWAILLARYCDTNDVCFGASISGRHAPVAGIDKMTGPAVSTVPIRVRLDQKKTVSNLLQDIQTQASEMVTFEQFGLRNIAKLSLEAQEVCEFSSLLVVQPIQHINISGSSTDSSFLLGATDMFEEERLEGYFNYPLVVQAFTHSEHIELVITYDPIVVPAPQVEALSHQFDQTMHQLLSQRDQILENVTVASNWDLQKAIEFNIDLPQTLDVTIHKLIENQANSTPNAIAIDAWDGCLTYVELNRAANRLALYLVEHVGTHIGEFVHLYFEKSVWFYVSMLAVNKAGAVWVPLDPSHPTQRQRHIISQTRASICLVSKANLVACHELMPKVLGVTSDLNKKLIDIYGVDPELNVRGVTPDHAAYVLFTSGSTGTPKGLIMQHRSVATSQMAIAKSLGLTSRVRILQFASYVFDLCIGEIIAPLISGASLCVPSEETRMNSLCEFINNKKVNWAFLTPSFVRTLKPTHIPGLELLLLTGETVGRDVFECWVGKLRLVTGWGPAETCVFSTLNEWYNITESPQNVGRPVGGRCWIVDPTNHNRLAPIGCIGEVVIQGPTILQEYLQNPNATSQSTVTSLPEWVPNRASPQWSRFFKSGDLCYYNPDGTIEFVSRKDNQVKIRGLRVELGEVEHHIRGALSNVHQVVVEVVKSGTGATLAAYFCFNDEVRNSSEADVNIFLPLDNDLRGKIVAAVGQLSIELPNYMVPSMFFPCKFMPSIVSTKLDRGTLKRLTLLIDQQRLVTYALAEGQKRVPINPMEVRLQRMWASMLKISPEAIGRDDSLLRIGGDSITVIKFVTTANEAGLSITVKDVFADPRLSAVASSVREGGAKEVYFGKPFDLLPASEIDNIQCSIRDQCEDLDLDSIEDAYPCSGLQEGLMALAVKQPGSYIASYAYSLSDHVDTNRLQNAWNRTLQVCTNLRTRIVGYKGASYQAILREHPTWEPSEGHSLASYMKFAKGFEMQYGSRLCRYALIKDPDGKRFFVLMLHHSIFDGWSLNLVLDSLYSIYVEDKTLSVQPLSKFIRYNENLDISEASAYWRGQLEGAQRAAFPRLKATSNVKPASQTVLRKLNFQERPDGSITLATILRAAWAIVLAKYCDTNDVCFGTTVSGRQAPIPNIETISGPTLATVPIRIRLDAEQKVSSFLAQVQEQATGMVQYEQFGLRNISKLGRDAREACDFFSLLIIQPAQSISTSHEAIFEFNTSEKLAGGSLEGYFTYPLVFQALMYEKDVELLFTYSPEAVSEGELDTLFHHFECAFRDLLILQDAPLRNISVASNWDEEKAMEYNPDIPEIIMDCVHNLFESQVRSQPSTVAIDGWDGVLTYAELDAAANRLSHHLIHNADVRVGEFVHVCFEKSIWFAVSILAINKAGAAWVPMDPSHPIKRLQQITDQTHARVGLASPANAERCTALLPRIIQVSARLDQVLISSMGSPGSPLCGVTPDHPSYILFTSGSTGVPKGLVMSHRSVCTSQIAISKRLGITSDVRMLQFSAHVFDLCVGEIIAPLISGATVCIPSEDSRMNNLTEYINQNNINWAILTSTFARTLKPHELPGLELLILSGEAVHRDVFNTWFGKLRLVGGWGPAETCVLSTIHEWASIDESPTNVGRPVGSCCWIVDPDDPTQLAPIGCIGEIVIQGPTLLTEYLNDPSKTLASTMTSLPNWAPYRQSRHWNRIFKTGDLCHYNPDGTIEFVSRKDTQVKIRGLRVELSEVEHYLRESLEGVHQVAVDVLRGDNGSSLVAYFCNSDETRVSSSLEVNSQSIFLSLEGDLHSQAARAISQLTIALPTYMVPSVFIPCRFMPSVTSLKLDRKSLNAMASSLSREEFAVYAFVDTTKQPPKTQTERRLQDIWAEVLQVPPSDIGRDDSFMRLGGDSITAIQLVTLARNYGLAISIKDVFADPRLSAMAAIAKVLEPEESVIQNVETFSLLPSQKSEVIISHVKEQCDIQSGQFVDDVYPCTSLQEGLMALTLKQPGSYIAKYIYRLPKDVTASKFRLAWEHTLTLCDTLRSRVILHDGTSFQAIIREKPSWEPTTDQSLASYMDNVKEISMSYGSKLCRYAFIHNKSGGNYFVLILHHAIFDGWSLNVALKTLHSIYYDIPVAPLRPYPEFIRYINQLNHDKATEYWLDQLQGAQRAAFPRTHASMESSQLSRIIKTKISLPDRKGGHITKATIIRAAWALTLAQYSDSDDVCFGTTISGRHAPVIGIERIAGPAVTTVPIRIRLDRKQVVSSFLHGVQEQASNMVPFEQFGLRNIAKISSEANEACKFSSLLVVQPVQHEFTNTDRTLLISASGTDEDNSLEGYFNYPLVVQGFIYGDHIELLLVVDPLVIPERQAQALSRHFDCAVQHLLARQDTELGVISLSSEWDLVRAIEYNSEIPEILPTTIHQLIEAQAFHQPDSIAIQSWDGHLTYSGLNSAANRLGTYLMDNMGVKIGDFIHICFEKSIWFYVSMLAINKAGAAWVPLDPSHPIQRQKQIVSQTKASLCLTSVTNFSWCSDLFPSVIEITPDLDQELVENYGLDPVMDIQGIEPELAAYVLFTSGSTGTPKGLIMQHQAVSTSQTAIAKRLRLNSKVRILQFASYVFDLCIGEIVAPLISGATLCVPSESTRMNHLQEFVKEMNVTWAFLTPSFARTFKPEDMPSLELLLLTGEAVSQDVFDNWVGNVRLVTGWGPAETCVFSTLHEWHSNKESPQTIGRPIGGSCWIVDPQNPLKLAPIGCIGEVMIQGPTLLREYLSDPGKTSAATLTLLPQWVPNGSSQNWSRFFKSGDLCYYNPDGTIEFVSRKDTQAKIRGMRIELGEIEHHLRIALPNIQQLAVEVVKTDSGTNLAAYICLSSDSSVASAVADADSTLLPIAPDLKDNIASAISYMSINLPGYMIPKLFFPCRYMPYITSTKLDRGALRRWVTELSNDSLARYSLADGEKRLPETPMESRIQELWSNALNIPVEYIGRDDNFLQIGGDSITAIQFVTLARQLGFSITVQDLFADPRLSVVALKMTKGEGTAYAADPFSLLNSASIDISAIKSRLKYESSLTSEYHIEDLYPCTSLQEGLMALAVKQPGSYIARYPYALPTSIDVGRFKTSWEQTLQQCSNLRSRIILHEGIAIQAIIQEEAIWESTDGLTLRTVIENLKGIEMQYGSRLCRYAIVTEPDDKSYFVLAAHHAIFDGWSLNILLDLLTRLYQAEPVPTLEPFSTFISYTKQIDNSAAAGFWKSQLGGAQSASFPQPSTSNNSDRSTRVMKHKIPYHRRDDTSITQASILRAAWAIVIARYSDTDDVVFGTVVSGRHAPIANLDRIFGPTVATVPIRVRVQQGKSVSDFLNEIQKQATDIIQYEQFGLQRISKLSADTKDACNFTCLMTVQPRQSSRLNTPDNKFIILPVDADIYGLRDNYFTYPLALEALTYDDEVELVFTYDSAHLPDIRIEALSRHLEHTISQLCNGKCDLLGQISITGNWDIEQLSKFGAISSPKVVADCVHQIISQQAVRNPFKEALYSTERSLNYGELDKMSSQIAIYLTQIGVHSEMIVPVCFEKSIWAIIAQLAIMKAGAAFLPLDPSHPIGRREALIKEVGAKVVLVSPQAAEHFSKLVNKIIVSETFISTLPKSPYRIKQYRPESNPKNAAYVFFTSGSTGKPKGVVVEQTALCSFIIGHGPIYELGPKSRVLQFSNYAFDGSLAEIYSPLVYGGTVCIPSENERMDGISKFINQANVSLAQFTPSFSRTLNPADLPTLKTVVLGGEALAKDNIDAWLGKVKLLNGYGPTETVVVCCLHIFQSDKDSPTTIGRGHNAKCLIVDAHNHFQLAPVGCVGELVVQGPTLARGYFNDPIKTEASFIENGNLVPSISNVSNARFYKTGDLAKYNFDGTIEYIGRKDTQVKIRGLRVELGEVEYQIGMSIESIKQVVVDVFKSDVGINLVAYYSLNERPGANAEVFLPLAPELESQTSTIRNYLGSVLPRYMIPTIIIPCSYIPSSTSGKLDRKALRTLTVALTKEALSRYALVSGKKQPAKTKLEAQIQSIWARILDIPIEGIGRDDSFMGLGGDSITAIQFVTLLRDQNMSITVNDIFVDPRLSAIAAKISGAESVQDYTVQPYNILPADQIESIKSTISDVCDVSLGDIEDAYPCSSLQEGLISLAIKQPGSYIAKHVYRLPHDIDIHRFRDAWNLTMQTFAILRTRIVAQNGIAVQTVIREVTEWESTDGLDLIQFMERTKEIEMGYGSRLSRCALVTEKHTARCFFVLVIHHAVFDGWSIQIILSTLVKLYQGENISSLHPYSSFINYATQIDQSAAAIYWAKQLDGAQRSTFPPTPNLPNYKPVSHVMKASIPFPKLVDTSITKATILRAAWALVLARYCYSTDVCFGTTVSGRQAPVANIDLMAGPTVTTIPIRIRLDNRKSIPRFLRDIQKQAVEMIPYEQFGLHSISNISPSAKEACEFSSLLVLQPKQITAISSADPNAALLTPDEESYKDEKAIEGYFSYPLVLQCLMFDEKVDLFVVYDSGALNETQLRSVIKHLTDAITQLQKELTSKTKSIKHKPSTRSSASKKGT